MKTQFFQVHEQVPSEGAGSVEILVLCIPCGLILVVGALFWSWALLNFDVLEMALKTLRFVQGLPTTPFIIFSSMFKNQIFQIYVFPK